MATGAAVASAVVPHRRPVLVVLLAAVAVWVLGACEVDSRVGVRVQPDGSGVVAVTVRLDEEAARRLGDPATALRLDDLAGAGWDVDEPGPVDGGGLALRAERTFASPEDLPAVLDEVGGAGGVFRDVQLSVVDGFASTRYDFAAQVELTGNPEQFGDEALTAAFGGLPLARTPEELALEGAADPGAMTLEVVVELPGGDPETNGEVREGAATWSFPVSGGEPTSASITSSSTVDDGRTRLLLLVGAVALVGAVVVGAIGLVRRRA